MKKLLLSIVFAVAIMNVFGTAKYWVGGASGNWASTSSWSLASDGTGAGAPVPVASDDVYFNAASGANVIAYCTGASPVLNSLNATSCNVTFAIVPVVTYTVASGVITTGSATIALTSTASIANGQFAYVQSGTGTIPYATTVSSFSANVSVTLSNKPTAANTGSSTIAFLSTTNPSITTKTVKLNNSNVTSNFTITVNGGVSTGSAPYDFDFQGTSTWTQAVFSSGQSIILGNGGTFYLNGNSAINYFDGNTSAYIQVNSSTNQTLYFNQSSIAGNNGIGGTPSTAPSVNGWAGIQVTRGIVTIANNVNTSRVMFGTTNASNYVQGIVLSPNVTLNITGNGTCSFNTTSNCQGIDAHDTGCKVIVTSQNPSFLTTANGNIIFKPSTTINSLELNRSGYIFTLPQAISVNSLTLTNGTINNSTNNITVTNGGTITRSNQAGLLTSPPVYGTSPSDRVNVTIGATCNAANELLGTTSGKVGTLTVNSGNTYTLSSTFVTGYSTLVGGTGYGSTPSVTFSAPSTAGGVTATASVGSSSGAFTSIVITNPGSGYTSAPTITFNSGGSGVSSPSGASAIALISTNSSLYADALNIAGTLNFANTASLPVTLNVGGDVTLAATGNITASNISNAVSHVLNIGGNITGTSGCTFDFTGGGITKSVNTTFNKGGAQSVSGTFTTLKFNALSTSSSGTNLTFSAAPTVLSTTTIAANTTIQTGAAYTATGGATVNGTFQINNSGSATGGTWTYGGSSTLAFNNSGGNAVNSSDVFWPTSSGPQNVTVLQGGLTLNSGANRTVAGVFQTAAGVTLSSATLTLNGTAQINAGGSFTNAPVYGNTSTLIYNTGGSYGIGNEWTGKASTAGTGVPQNVSIQNTTTLTFPTSDRGCVGNFNIISGGATLNATSGDLYVAGNFSNSGTFTHSNRAVFLNGASGTTQTISGTLNGTSTTNCFPYLIINNTNGGVSLSSPVNVTNTFTLTSGIVTTTSTNLLTITNTSNSAISGGSSTKFINGPVAWTLPASSASTYLFPVGSGSSYYPLSLASPTTSTSGTTVANVQAVLSGSGGSADGTTLSAISPNEYWSIAASVGDITGGKISLTRSGVSIGSFNAIGTSGTLAGSYSSIGGTVSGSSINTSNSISTIPAASSNYYALGVIASTDPSITTITGGFNGTSGYIGQTLTITGLNFTSGATVTFNGGSSIATTYVDATQLTVVVPANATTGNIVVTSSGKTTAGYSYTILGYVSSADGDWNTSGTWTNNTIPPAGSTVTINNAVTVNSAVSNSPTSVIIGGGSLTFGASGSLGVTNFTISSGTSLVMTSGGTLNIASGGSMTNNSGTFTYGTGTIAFAGTGSFTGVTNLYNVTIAGGVNFSGTTINGTLSINSGGYVNTTAPTYASGSTLKYNTGGTYGRNTEWTTTTGAGYPANVQISNSTLLDIGANTGGATARQISGDLIVDAGSTLTMAGGTSANGTQAMTAAFTVLGSVANSGTLTLSGSAGGDIKVGSNWTNSGTFTPNTRAVFFTGSGASSINSATNFDYLLISKTSATVTLGAACTVNQDLTLTSGTLDYATYTLTVAGNVAVTSGTLATASAGTLAMTGTSKTIAALALGNFSISGTTNTVTASGALSIANGKTLTINSGNTLAMSTNALTAASGSFIPAVNGTLSTANTTATPIPAYDWTNGNTATGTVSFGGTGTIPATSTFYNLATTVTGAVYGNGTITIYGNFSPAASSTATQGTLVFANTTATQSTSAFTFKNLTVNNTSANGVQASGNISVSATGTLTIGTNAILDLQANALSTLGTTSGSGTLKTSNTTATPIVASKTYAFLVEYTNTSGGQTVPTGVTLNGGLKCDNTSNNVTAAGSFSIGGKLTMASTTGTFDLVGYTLTNGSTAFDASSFAGTFKTSAGGSSANQFPAGVTWADNSTVIYYAAASSNTRLTPASYYNLDADNGKTQSLNFDYPAGSTASFTVRNTFTAVSTQVNPKYTTFNFTGTGQTIPAWTFYNLSLGTNSVLPSGTVTVYGTFNPGNLTSASQGTIVFSPVPYNAALGLTIPAFTYKNLTVTGNVNTISNKSGSTYLGSPAIAMNSASDVTGLAVNAGIKSINLPSNAVISATSNTATTSYVTTPYYIVYNSIYYLSYPNTTNSQTDFNNTAANQAVLTGTGGTTAFNGVYVTKHFGAQTGSANFSALFTDGSATVTFTKNSATSGLNAGMIVTTTNPNVSIPDGTYIQSASAASGSGPYTFTVVLSAPPTVTGGTVTDNTVLVGSVNILSGALSGFSTGTTYGNTTNPNFSYSPGIVLSANATGSGSVTDISTYGINVTVPTGVAVSGLFTDNHTGNFNLVTNTGAVNLNSGATISTGSGTTYYSPFNITLASGATATAAGNLYFGGTVTVPSNATLNMSTYTLNAGIASGNSFSPSLSGTLSTSNTGTTPIPSGQTYGGTVEFAASSSQTIPSNTYNNLTLSNSGTKTTGGALTVNGALTTTAGGTLATASTLTNNGSATINGNLQLNAGGSVAGSGTLSYGSSARLVYNNGGSFSTALEWPSSNGPANVTVQATGTSVTPNENKTISGNLTIGSGATLNVAANKQLTVSTSMTNGGTLNLLSDASGTATILTPASISGANAATVQQYLSGTRNWYISSPVSGSSVPALGYTFYSRNEPAANWTTMTSDSILKVGRGYIANLTSGTDTYSFTGTLNSGDKSISLGRTNGVDKTGFNLIGNPYPSNFTVLKSATDAADALNTIWYRTATWVEDPNPAKSKYVYSFQTCLLAPDGSTMGSPITTTNIIPPMQAFWVRTNTDATLFTFSNSQRSHQSSNPLKITTKRESNQSILRLQVSNGSVSDEAVIYSNVNASNGFDSYDALKMNNNSASVPEIYTLVDGQQTTINGMNNIPMDTEIAIGFTTGTAGTFSIKASQISNFDPSVSIYLKDYSNLVNTPVLMTADAAYTFSSGIINNNASRFALIFKSSSIATGFNGNENQNCWISVNGANQVVVNGTPTAESSVAVYNAIGQKLFAKNLTSGSTTLNTPLLPGVYLVSVTSNGKTLSKKVIID